MCALPWGSGNERNGHEQREHLRVQRCKEWPLGHVSNGNQWTWSQNSGIPFSTPPLLPLLAGRLPSRLCLCLLVPGLSSLVSFADAAPI